MPLRWTVYTAQTRAEGAGGLAIKADNYSALRWPMIDRNSLRVASFSRNTPIIRLVAQGLSPLPLVHALRCMSRQLLCRS